MKHEWRKHEKTLYGVKQEPRIVEMPELQYIAIDGKGNPNGEDFAKRVTSLYSIAYPIKMQYKKENIENAIPDFTVYPLEGLWGLEKGATFSKENFVYTIMIRQPDFITEEMFETARKHSQEKNKNDLLVDEVVFKTYPARTCVDMLHVGGFDDEPVTFAKMNSFAEQEGRKRKSLWHREIYLNDPRRIATEKLKTILQFEIE